MGHLGNIGRIGHRANIIECGMLAQRSDRGYGRLERGEDREAIGLADGDEAHGDRHLAVDARREPGEERRIERDVLGR